MYCMYRHISSVWHICSSVVLHVPTTSTSTPSALCVPYDSHIIALYSIKLTACCFWRNAFIHNSLSNTARCTALYVCMYVCPVLTAETVCVYCAVRTGYLSARIIWNELKAFHRRGSGSTPGHSMSDLWWTNCHCDRFLSQYLRPSPDSIIPPMLRTCLHTVLIRTSGRMLVTSNKAMLIRIWGGSGYKNTVTWSCFREKTVLWRHALLVLQLTAGGYVWSEFWWTGRLLAALNCSTSHFATSKVGSWRTQNTVR
jgi:hypothetical protein